MAAPSTEWGQPAVIRFSAADMISTCPNTGPRGLRKEKGELALSFFPWGDLDRLPCLAVLAGSVTVAGPVAEALSVPRAVACSLFVAKPLAIAIT